VRAFAPAIRLRPGFPSLREEPLVSQSPKAPTPRERRGWRASRESPLSLPTDPLREREPKPELEERADPLPDPSAAASLEPRPRAWRAGPPTSHGRIRRPSREAIEQRAERSIQQAVEAQSVERPESPSPDLDP
jgi:hypothetical protein